MIISFSYTGNILSHRFSYCHYNRILYPQTQNWYHTEEKVINKTLKTDRENRALDIQRQTVLNISTIKTNYTVQDFN